MAHQLILVLDFGSQYTQLIARRIREQSGLLRDPPVHARPRSRAPAAPGDEADRHRAVGRAVVGLRRGRADDLAGAVRARRADPRHLLRRAAHRAAARRRCPAGGPPRVRPRHRARQAGPTACSAPSTAGEELVGVGVARRPRRGAAAGLRPHRRVRQLHDVGVRATPAKRIHCVQFHPEVVHTPRGAELLGNLLFGVCNAAGDWSMASFVDEAVARIRAAGRRPRPGDLRAVRRRRLERRRGACSTRRSATG